MKPVRTHTFNGGYILVTFKPDTYQISGWYDEDADAIFISSSLSRYWRAFTLAHERQHQRCCKTKCKCWQGSREWLCEYHAFKAELDFVSGTQEPKRIAEYLKYVAWHKDKYTRLKDKYPKHLSALQALMNLKAFKELT